MVLVFLVPVAAQNTQTDELIERAKVNSLKYALAFSSDYSSNFTVTIVDKTSEQKSYAYEYLCARYGCRTILVGKNGKPFSDKKIRRNRQRAARQLKEANRNPPASTARNEVSELKPGHAFWVNGVFLQPNSILANCDLRNAGEIALKGRRSAIYYFDNCVLKRFSERRLREGTAFLPESKGTLWIDIEDGALVKAELFRRSAKMKTPVAVIDCIRMEDGNWFWKQLKVHSLENRDLFPMLESDWQIDFSKYTKYKTSVGTVTTEDQE